MRIDLRTGFSLSRHRPVCHPPLPPPRPSPLLLLLILHSLCPCPAVSARSDEAPLSPHLAPTRIAPRWGLLESPWPRCAHRPAAPPTAEPAGTDACDSPPLVPRGAGFVAFTPEQRQLLSNTIVPALLAAFARGPHVLQLREDSAQPLPPANADVCRTVGGSADGIALYVAPLLDAGVTEADVVRCAGAVVLFLRPDALHAAKTADTVAPQLSKALGIDGCPDTDAVLLRGVLPGSGGGVHEVCVGVRCADGGRVEVQPTGAKQWTECTEGVLPIACPQYADVCATPPPAAAHKPVKKRDLSMYSESDGLTRRLKSSDELQAAKKATVKEPAAGVVTATTGRVPRSPGNAPPANTLLGTGRRGASDGGNAVTLAAPWAMVVLLLAVA